MMKKRTHVYVYVYKLYIYKRNYNFIHFFSSSLTTNLSMNPLILSMAPSLDYP